MSNAKISDIFEKIADILEIKGENTFRIRAYRNAAQTIASLNKDASEIAEKYKLTSLPGIGEDLALKIREFIETGKISAYEKLRKDISPAVLDMLGIPGVGPKTAKILYDHLKIKSLKDLEAKARAHKISGLPGVKEKTEENIIRGLEFLKKDKGRMHLDTAFMTAQSIISGLKRVPHAAKISPAGSLRRMKETIRDIDILVTCDKNCNVMERFLKYPKAGNFRNLVT